MAAVRRAWAVLREAMANPGIRRVEIAWLLSVAADAALLVLLLVELYARDGAVGAGLLGAIRMAPAIVAGMGVGSLVARFSTRRLLVALALLRAVAALLIAVVVAGDGPSVALYLLAALGGAAGAPLRPAELMLLPALSRSPSELVAANVAWGTVEGIGSLVGPLLAGALVADPATAWLVAAAAGVGFAAIAGLAGTVRLEQAADEAAGGGAGVQVLQGLRAIRRRPVLRWSMVAVYAQVLTRGLLNALIVVASVELLGTGDAGVGVLSAAVGVGGLVGGVFSMSLVSSGNLVRALATSLAYWGMPIAVVGLLPVPAVAVAALIVVGIANSAFDVAMITIFQRGSANDERGPVFSLFEGVAGLGLVSGSLLAPLLVAWLRPVGALAISGSILPIVALVIYGRIGRADRVAVVDEPTVRLLRHVPAFAELPLTAIERLALGLEARRFAPGERLMVQGEDGDEFLVIEQGEVDVLVDGRPIHRLGHGAGVGEIALLRRSPRSATVVAVSEVVALGVTAPAFCAALSGPAAATAMERAAAANLARASATG